MSRTALKAASILNQRHITLGECSKLTAYPVRTTPTPTRRLVRRYIHQTTGQQSSSRRKLSPFLTLLLCSGIAATAYGVYDIYQTMTLWPQEVRGDLRGGLSARDKGDLELSEQYFRRAWETSKTLPLELFKDQPHLKISGIAICLAGVLESNNQPEKAYVIYAESLARLRAIDTKELSGPEKLRIVTISYKLGELASDLKRPEEAEQYLVLAVETTLKNVTNGQSATQPASAEQMNDLNTHTMMTELELPSWSTKTDTAAPFEALGSFYAQSGKLNFAMPLYLQAISILIPPPPRHSSIEDRCRGAQLMSNLSELIIRSPNDVNSETLHQAEAWAAKGLDIVMRSREESSDRHPTCEVTLAVALFNIAALRQMAGDHKKAKEYFLLSLTQAKTIGMHEGVVHAEDALRQLDTDTPDTSPV